MCLRLQIIALFHKTAGIPRNTHAEHLEPADEMPDIAHEPAGDDGDFGPSEQNFHGESVLNLAE